ncbi:hypothetical protein SUGI_0786670 [Cryptomeria japonica]|nr:hypothetical protein SUGI_0786670 [Cryptomeria japonica]
MYVIVIISILAIVWRVYWHRRSSSWIPQIPFLFAEEEDYQTDHGLNKKVIHTVPVFVYKEESFKNDEKEQLMCVICCSKFEQNEKGRELPKCNHRFHVNCIDKWFELQSTCPICRMNVEDAISDEKGRIEEEDHFSIVADDIVIDMRSLEGSVGDDIVIDTSVEEMEALQEEEEDNHSDNEENPDKFRTVHTEKNDMVIAMEQFS